MAHPDTLPEWNTGGANRAEPSPTKKTTGHVSGEDPSSSHENWWKNKVYEWVKFMEEEAYSGFFGDGSDGDVTIAAPTTLSAGVKNYNNLTLNSTLEVDGVFVRVANTLTINSGGKLHRNGQAGGNGSAGAGGSAGSAGTPARPLAPGFDGGGGGGGVAAGAAGTAATESLGGAGGAGGTAGPGGGAGGAVSSGPSFSDFRALPEAALGQYLDHTGWTQLKGGAGGGGGDSNGAGTSGGGGGGAGAGVLVVCAREIIINTGGAIECIGGAGGSGAGNDGSGGGGGGGGVAIIIYRSANATIATLVGDGRISVAGGAAGAAGGAGGGAGTNGSAGAVRSIFA